MRVLLIKNKKNFRNRRKGFCSIVDQTHALLLDTRYAPTCNNQSDMKEIQRKLENIQIVDGSRIFMEVFKTVFLAKH